MHNPMHAYLHALKCCGLNPKRRKIYGRGGSGGPTDGGLGDAGAAVAWY